MHINPISIASYQKALTSSLNTSTLNTDTTGSLPAVGTSGGGQSAPGPIKCAFEQTLSSELGLTAPSTATGTSTTTGTSSATGTATTTSTSTTDGAKALVKALRAFEAALYQATGGSQQGSSATGVTSGGTASSGTAVLSTNSTAYTGFENRLEGVIQGLTTS